MAKLTPLQDRRRHIMNEAGKRWQKSSRGQKVLDQLAALGDSAALDTPLRQQQFSERETVLQRAAELRALGKLPIGLERKIGPTLDFIELAPSDAARKAGRPVIRIVTSCDPNVEAVGFATGFLVAPQLLLTNWHVFNDVASARGNGANFFHERSESGVAVGDTFEVDPDYFFLSNERLDFALVGIKPKSVTNKTLADVAPIAMTSSPAKILVGQPVNIIQHPDGGPKTWVTMNENRLIDISEEGFLQYTADTLQGSSGSPVFSTSWELVGLHHSGVPEMHDGKIVAVDGTVWDEDMGDDKVHWIANEGARTSAIVRALAETKLDDPKQQSVLSGLIAGTGDPIEEVKKLLDSPGGGSVAIPSEAATIIGAGERPMVFTGPVTIIVGAGADAVSGVGQAFERTIQFDQNYDDREGYKADFLGDGLIVPQPTTSTGRKAEMLLKDGAVQVLNYHHYSLAMNAKRRLPMWTAANVDYSPARRAAGGARAGFGSDKWVFDPRIPKDVQLGDQFYEPARQSDRGHIVRRQDSAWGDTETEVEFANSDTFHWTNCTPQHAAFNRASAPSKYQLKEGLWGGFEMYTQGQLLHGDTRACILAGPILADDDLEVDLGRGPVLVPRRFWKVVVVKGADGKKPALDAYAFILSQEDLLEKFGIEFAPGRFEKYRTSLALIADAAGVEFDKIILAAERHAATAQ